MGGRYGGDIKGRGRGSAWSTRKALEAIGREAFGIQFRQKQAELKRRGRGTPA